MAFNSPVYSLGDRQFPVSAWIRRKVWWITRYFPPFQKGKQVIIDALQDPQNWMFKDQNGNVITPTPELMQLLKTDWKPFVVACVDHFLAEGWPTFTVVKYANGAKVPVCIPPETYNLKTSYQGIAESGKIHVYRESTFIKGPPTAQASYYTPSMDTLDRVRLDGGFTMPQNANQEDKNIITWPVGEWDPTPDGNLKSIAAKLIIPTDHYYSMQNLHKRNLDRISNPQYFAQTDVDKGASGIKEAMFSTYCDTSSTHRADLADARMRREKAITNAYHQRRVEEYFHNNGVKLGGDNGKTATDEYMEIYHGLGPMLQENNIFPLPPGMTVVSPSTTQANVNIEWEYRMIETQSIEAFGLPPAVYDEMPNNKGNADLFDGRRVAVLNKWTSIIGEFLTVVYNFIYGQENYGRAILSNYVLIMRPYMQSLIKKKLLATVTDHNGVPIGVTKGQALLDNTAFGDGGYGKYVLGGSKEEQRQLPQLEYLKVLGGQSLTQNQEHYKSLKMLHRYVSPSSDVLPGQAPNSKTDYMKVEPRRPDSTVLRPIFHDPQGDHAVSLSETLSGAYIPPPMRKRLASGRPAMTPGTEPYIDIMGPGPMEVLPSMRDTTLREMIKQQMSIQQRRKQALLNRKTPAGESLESVIEAVAHKVGVQSRGLSPEDRRMMSILKATAYGGRIPVDMIDLDAKIYEAPMSELILPFAESWIAEEMKQFYEVEGPSTVGWLIDNLKQVLDNSQEGFRVQISLRNEMASTVDLPTLLQSFMIGAYEPGEVLESIRMMGGKSPISPNPLATKKYEDKLEEMREKHFESIIAQMTQVIEGDLLGPPPEPGEIGSVRPGGQGSKVKPKPKPPKPKSSS